jgi:hypothetical protein
LKQFILFLAIFCSLHVYAQLDSVPARPPYIFHVGMNYDFEMKNGTKYTGVVIGEDEIFVSVTHRNTKENWELRKSEILRFNIVAGPQNKDRAEALSNPHSRDYLLSTSAFLFKPNQLSSNGHWFLLDQIDYAFTENVALSVHTLAFYPMAMGLKVAFPVGEMDYIGGSLAGMVNLGAFSSAGPAFMGYLGSARYTHGTENRNITLSAGVLGLNSALLYELPTEPFMNTPFTSVAFCNQFAPRTALNLEGWYVPNEDVVLAGIGIKFLEDENSCWNFGCYTLMQRINNNLQLNLKALPIPYIGVSRKFN